MKELREELGPKFMAFNIEIDPNSLTRLALSMCRLKFIPEMNGNVIKEARVVAYDAYTDFYAYLKKQYADDDYIFQRIRKITNRWTTRISREMLRLHGKHK